MTHTDIHTHTQENSEEPGGLQSMTDTAIHTQENAGLQSMERERERHTHTHTHTHTLGCRGSITHTHTHTHTLGCRGRLQRKLKEGIERKQLHFCEVSQNQESLLNNFTSRENLLHKMKVTDCDILNE